MSMLREAGESEGIVSSKSAVSAAEPDTASNLAAFVGDEAKDIVIVRVELGVIVLKSESDMLSGSVLSIALFGVGTLDLLKGVPLEETFDTVRVDAIGVVKASTAFKGLSAIEALALGRIEAEPGAFELAADSDADITPSIAFKPL